MRTSRLLLPALILWTATPAQAGQAPQPLQAETTLASATSGSLQGSVLDEAGAPLNGAVISVLGSRTVFGVTDSTGQYRLRDLPPGPYLIRVHLPGYTSARGTMADVRPAVRTTSSFTLRRTDAPIDAPEGPRLVAAASDASEPEPDARRSPASGRDESETAWRLRRLRRSILKNATVTAFAQEGDPPFLAQPVEFLRHAVGSSAKLTSAYLTSGSLEGQLHWLTTGAFDDPVELLQLERTQGVTLFSVGAPVSDHGDWQLRGAINQGDLSSWVLGGSYAVRAPAAHRYSAGMSYGAQHYEGGNALAVAAMPEGARNVGAVFGSDEWTISRTFSVGYGAHYAHHNYLESPALLSPHAAATFSLTPTTRIRASATRRLSAPGGEEFLPARRAEFIPPQRTFSSLPSSRFRSQATQHYELELERVYAGVTVAARTFHQRVSNQMATLFAVNVAGTSGGDHYVVATAGDMTMHGAAVSFTHPLGPHVRGSTEYAFGRAEWTDGTGASDAATLAVMAPSVAREGREQLHDVTTTVEAEVPLTATRVFFLYRISNGFADQRATTAASRVDGRFDVQLTQKLPLDNFLRAAWEASISVRNVFREAVDGGSAYDELLVVRSPKRVVGGLTVSF